MLQNSLAFANVKDRTLRIELYGSHGYPARIKEALQPLNQRWIQINYAGAMDEAILKSDGLLKSLGILTKVGPGSRILSVIFNEKSISFVSETPDAKLVAMNLNKVSAASGSYA